MSSARRPNLASAEVSGSWRSCSWPGHSVDAPCRNSYTPPHMAVGWGGSAGSDRIRPPCPQLWCLPFGDTSAALAAVRGRLPPEEAGGISRQTTSRQAQHLIGRALLRSTLSTIFGGAPASWRLRYEPTGRLALEGNDSAAPVAISISHTEGLVTCAVAAGTEGIGVDCERRGRNFEFTSLAENLFADTEAAVVGRAHGSDVEDCFLSLWTLKEAYAKARGLGLTLPLDTAVFTLPEDSGDEHVAVRFPRFDDDPARWTFLRPFSVGSSHVVAAAKCHGSVGNSEQSWNVQMFQLEELT